MESLCSKNGKIGGESNIMEITETVFQELNQAANVTNVRISYGGETFGLANKSKHSYESTHYWNDISDMRNMVLIEEVVDQI